MQTPTTSQVRRYYQAGFTLIELLIVIAIIGILAAIAVPQYGNYLDRSERSACMSELGSFRSLAIATATVGGNASSDALPAEIENFDFQSCATTGENAAVKDDLIAQFVATSGNSEITVRTTNRDQLVAVSENGQITIPEPAE